MDAKMLNDLVVFLNECRQSNPGNIGLTPYLYGVTGVGKTTLAYQLSELRKARFVRITPVFEFPEVISGIPRIRNFKSGSFGFEYAIPPWAITCIQEPTVLLIDECDKAPEKLGVLLALLDSRTIHNQPIHPETVILLAGQPWSTLEFLTQTQRALITRSVFIKITASAGLNFFENTYKLNMRNLRKYHDNYKLDIPRLPEEEQPFDLRRIHVTIRSYYESIFNPDHSWMFDLMLSQFSKKFANVLQEDIAPSSEQLSEVVIIDYAKKLTPKQVWNLKPGQLLPMVRTIWKYSSIDTICSMLAYFIFASDVDIDTRRSYYAETYHAWCDAILSKGILAAGSPGSTSEEDILRIVEVCRAAAEFLHDRNKLLARHKVSSSVDHPELADFERRLSRPLFYSQEAYNKLEKLDVISPPKTTETQQQTKQQSNEESKSGSAEATKTKTSKKSKSSDKTNQ